MQDHLVAEKKYNVLIVGAGVAGMSAAGKLLEDQLSFAIIEKNNLVGGLARTYRIMEDDLMFCTDNGPHLFSYGTGEINNFINSIIPKEKTIPIQLKEKIVINGKILTFPVIPKQMLISFGPSFVAKSLLDYSIGMIQYKLMRKPASNFSHFVTSNLGKTLAKATTINYLEKIFGIPAEELHLDLAKQRFNFLNISLFVREYIKDVLRDNFSRKRNQSTVKKNTTMYPKSGIGLFSEILQDKIRKAGHPILFNSKLKKLNHNGSNEFTDAIVSVNGKDETVVFDYVIESIPIEEFIKLISPLPPQPILDAASKLPYRDQVYLFITLDSDRISEYHSIYFADVNIPFCRVTEMKNFDEEMSPPGKTSLLIEFFCSPGDDISTLGKEDLLNLTLPHLTKYFHFDRNKIRNYYLFPLYKAYPIYNLEYKKNLEIIMNYLNSFNNLFYIGRTGKFEYISQPKSIGMGMKAAKKIINDKGTYLKDKEIRNLLK